MDNDELKTEIITLDSGSKICAEIYRHDTGQYSFVCFYCGHICDCFDGINEHISETHFSNHPFQDNGCENNSNYIAIKNEPADESKDDDADDDEISIIEVGEEHEFDYMLPKIIPSNNNITDNHLVPKTEPKKLQKEVDTKFENSPITQEIVCNYCGKIYPNKKRLLLHLITCNASFKPFKCKVCNKSYTAQHLLRCHSKIHGKIRKTFQCDICSKTITTKPSLRKHLRVHAGESPYKNKSPRKKVQCDICSKVLSSSEAFRNHRRMHTGEKPYICKSCDKVFTFRSTLYRHVMRVHADDKIQCDIRSKTFSSKLTFKRHIQSHTKDSYRCKICNESFTDWNGWKRHEQQHKNKKPLKCDICLKTFSSKVSLTDHLQFRHTNDGESKKIQCDICSKTLRKQNLKNHMRIHTGERPFRCKICKKRFRFNGNLNRHILTHKKYVHTLDSKTFKT